VAFLTRLGEGLVPGPDTVYQEGDLVHLVIRETDLERAQELLAAAPVEAVN
jgi:trk system potassium uptake protein TrkA